MKILFTANRFPYPPYRGDKLKIFHLAKRLSKQHELHLVTFLQDEADKQYLPELAKYFTEIHLVPLSKFASVKNVLFALGRKLPFQVAYFQSAAMHQKITELKAKHQYDAVHVQHLRMAQYWYNDTSIPRILDLPDAFSLYWQRRMATTSGWRNWFNTMEQRRVFKYEDVLNRFDMSLVCSKEDKHYLTEMKGISNLQLLPNGVDMNTFSGKEHNYKLSQDILFTGNMDYAPNVDAVVYFAKEIFPLIKQAVPGTRFIIAGQRPISKVQELVAEDVVVTGFVPDLASLYASAAIVVAPLRFGAGTQNKVLEAMAMGVPVVSKNIGFNGLNIESGEGVILSLETIDFAEQCIKLLQSEVLRSKVGTAGKRVVQQQFDWEVIAAQLLSYISTVVKQRNAG